MKKKLKFIKSSRYNKLLLRNVWVDPLIFESTKWPIPIDWIGWILSLKKKVLKEIAVFCGLKFLKYLYCENYFKLTI